MTITCPYGRFPRNSRVFLLPRCTAWLTNKSNGRTGDTIVRDQETLLRLLLVPTNAIMDVSSPNNLRDHPALDGIPQGLV